MKIEVLNYSDGDLLKDKYIFHGSPRLFDICQPNQATCATNSNENTKFAIYGSNKIEFAILFAFEKTPLSKNSGWRATSDNGIYRGTLFNMKIEDDAFGYLYCFDKKDFSPTELGSIQEFSVTALKPVTVFKVKYSDFNNLFELVEKDFPYNQN